MLGVPEDLVISILWTEVYKKNYLQPRVFFLVNTGVMEGLCLTIYFQKGREACALHIFGCNLPSEITFRYSNHIHASMIVLKIQVSKRESNS